MSHWFLDFLTTVFDFSEPEVYIFEWSLAPVQLGILASDTTGIESFLKTPQVATRGTADFGPLKFLLSAKI